MCIEKVKMLKTVAFAKKIINKKNLWKYFMIKCFLPSSLTKTENDILWCIVDRLIISSWQIYADTSMAWVYFCVHDKFLPWTGIFVNMPQVVAVT